jgi:LysM repeat protein
MGSIRPLVTIAILGVVGVYLYIKINEGPVPTRASANAVGQSPDGVPPLTGTKGTSLAAETGAPAWPSTAPATTPPAPAATTSTPPKTGSPAATTLAKDGLPAVPAIPELPPLPAMNDPTPPATQSTPPLPNDLPANNPIARYPDQPGQSSNGTGAKDTALQPAPLSTTDPSKTTPPPAPQASLTSPNITPATSPALIPATNVAPQSAPLGAAAISPSPSTQSSAQNPLRTTPPATPAPDDRYGTAPSTARPPIMPAAPTTPIGATAATSFADSWPAIQSALDRRDLKQAHQLLSKWHGDESLSPTDTAKVETLLSQLAGTVIYSTEHQLEPARVVKPGETLDAISKEYNVPAQLLAKINGIQPTGQLQPGQQLKVVRGPFAAVVDLSRNELTLTVDDRYAGKFHVMIPPGTSLTDGQWLVDQKLSGSTTTASPSAYGTTPIPADRSIILRNASATAAGAPGLIISSGPAPAGLAASPPSLRVSPQDAEEISDILSVGSRVVVRK